MCMFCKCFMVQITEDKEALFSEVVFGDQQDSVTHSKPPAKPHSKQKTTVCFCGAAAGCSVIGGILFWSWIC